MCKRTKILSQILIKHSENTISNVCYRRLAANLKDITSPFFSAFDFWALQTFMLLLGDFPQHCLSSDSTSRSKDCVDRPLRWSIWWREGAGPLRMWRKPDKGSASRLQTHTDSMDPCQVPHWDQFPVPSLTQV